MMKPLLKFLHELGAIGVIGALGAYVILLLAAPAHAPTEYAVVRQAIAAIANWMLLPSLAVVLISGLLAIAAHRPFMDARWVGVKALLGLSMFEGTLVAVAANARRGAELSAQAVANGGDPTLMA
jgi:uncharacterized membrane protein YgdD (TMEM256/DUF423 family)